MGRFWRALLDHPVVLATLATGLVGGALHLVGQPFAARVLVSAFAVLVALQQARGMVEDLRSGSYGIDLLAVTAIGSTVAVGEYWAALVVCLMLTGGEALEELAERRARRELTSLLERAPRRAHLASGEEVDVETVEVGDHLLVRPFETVPVDGVLVAGSASLDESSLTGESLPVHVEAGEAVLSGAVNGGAAIEVRATARAADSQYQRIVRLAVQAQESKAPFVRLADRVAVPFTLLALGIAGAAWALSGDPTRFAEVLVVATPCPLIIAAPVAFLGGMSRAARGGVIVKHSGALEQLSRARTAALDKTGTLTFGTPRVTGVHPAGGADPEHLLALAAAVERFSTHPLARALVERAVADGVPVPDAFDAAEVPARGVRAQVDGVEVAVGSARLVEEVTGRAAPVPANGASVVHVAVDGRYAGHLALTDVPRPEARATIDALRRAGVRSVMVLTGDGARVARHVAAQVGIDDVRADLLPQDKVDAVRAARPRPVLMVGDGVNDAPVLAAADVGVAMGARGARRAAHDARRVAVDLDRRRDVRRAHARRGGRSPPRDRRGVDAGGRRPRVHRLGAPRAAPGPGRAGRGAAPRG